MNTLVTACCVSFVLGFCQVASAISLLDGFGGARDYGELAMSRNDDGSSNLLNLPFEINFFGNSYSNYYINNNGNISFNAPIWEYTPQAFPISDQPMIAPYWGDVDTRNDPGDNSNNVWVASPNEDTVVVTWDMVGFYSADNSLRNDFQLVLRNRPELGAGNFDVDFRYNQLQWTTGDASGGVAGLGGIPAQAGYDSGQGAGGEYFILPGSFSDQVLNLQNTSNVSALQPGLWTFAIRNGQLPGTDPSNPLMPIVTQEGWDFDFGVELNQQVWIDPILAIGYDYLLNSGPFFQTVELPDVGDGLFDLYLWNAITSTYDFITQLAQGVEYDFGIGGVDRFRILGIETAAGLDPNDPLAFVTGLTFAGAGIVNMSMNPITVNTNPVGAIPEPSTAVLLGVGLVAALAAKRRLIS